MKSTTTLAMLTGLFVTAAFAAPTMKADTDDNGLISLDEFKAMKAARVEEQFARLDTDADGFISADEMQAAPRRGHERFGKREHRKERNPAKAVERLDADGSGGVSLQELEGKRFAPSSDAFSAADGDGNGELDAAEFHTMMMATKAERRAEKQSRED